MAAVAMLAVMFAGCSDKDPGPSAEELCEGIFADGVCTQHTEPAVAITGLDSSVSAYLRHDFTWYLDNGTRGVAPEPAVHSMDSRIVAVTDGSMPGNETLPDAFGTQVARQEHKDLPDQFTAQFSWNEVGATVTLWGYMLIDGGVWNLITNITIVEPPATGITQNVTFDAGPPPGASPSNLPMQLGDGIQFINENAALGYTITFGCGIDAISVDPDSTSPTVVIKRPMTCQWEATSDLAEFGITNADLDGQFTVNVP